MKRILRITTEINRSSIGRTTEQIGKLVLAEGWDSYIAYGRADGISDSKKIKIGNKLTVYFHVLLSRMFDLHGLGSYFATKRLVNDIILINPDIIHLHDIHGYYINLKVLFKYLSDSNKPVVWTQHDCWSFTGHCGSYSSINCDKWKTGCNNCPSIHEYPSSWIFDNSMHYYQLKKNLFTSISNLYLVAVSEWMVSQLKESFFKNNRILKISNGIDTDIFKPCPESSCEIRNKYNLGDGILLMAFATAWGEKKGLSDYIKLREILDKKYKLIFVGAPKSLIERLPEGIVGIERTDNMQELVKLYSASTIIMNLGGDESFGKTTPEGLACGIPGIVYNCTASPELVDEHTGIIVEKGDIEGIKSAIEIITNWDKSETSMRCRKRACELFSINNNWPKYIELYKQILNTK